MGFLLLFSFFFFLSLVVRYPKPRNMRAWLLLLIDDFGGGTGYDAMTVHNDFSS